MTIHYPIGIEPDQVPLNGMLGELARMSSAELGALVEGSMTERLSATGLGTVNDLRDTIFERGAPGDVFGTGFTTGLARAGSDGVGIPGFGTDEFGSLIVNAQWDDSSIGPAYNRIYFRSGRMWFQAMKTTTTWDTWNEVLTGSAKAIAALGSISAVAADQIPYFTGAGSAGTTALSQLGRQLIANTNLGGMLGTLGIQGVGTYTDLRGTVYEKGVPNDVMGKGTIFGFARGGSDGLKIPAFGSTSNVYGVLIVFSQWSDSSGGPAFQRMFLRQGRVFLQLYNSGTAWGLWSEVYSQQSILGSVSQSGGVPTGAIIERGGNSNGEYIRWADGTQFCLGTSGSYQTNDVLGGPIYRSGNITCNFSASFVAPPACYGMTVNQQASLSWLGADQTPTTTYCQLYLLSCNPSTIAAIKYVAFGRWY